MDNKGVVIMVNKLPGQDPAWQITALNFGRSPLEQSVHHPGMAGDAQVRWSNLRGAVSEKAEYNGDSLLISLLPMEAKLVVVFGSAPP